MTQGLKPLGSFSVSALRYYYRRHAADTLIKELHAADNLDIIVLFLKFIWKLLAVVSKQTRGANTMLP